MNDNYKEWFTSGLKMKRWLLLVVAGVLVLSYGLSNIIAAQTMNMMKLITVGISIVLGLTFTVVGFIMAQRRLLQAMAEAGNGISGRNINMKKLMFDKNMLDRNMKIVVISGGTGLSTVLKGLKVFSNSITAIVTTANDGSEKNNISKEFDILPPNDLRQSIVALSDKEDIMEELMQYNFTKGSIKGYNFGNLLLAAMNDMCDGNFAKAIRYTSNVLSITGKVLPVTLDRVNMGALLTDGTRVVGESNIPEKVIERKAAIEKLYLIPERCTPAPEVISSIKDADVIIIGPGSLYTGIIPNLLIKEVSDEIKKSKATKILVSNIMSQPGQTDGYKVSDMITAIHEHIGKGLIEYCLANDSVIMPEYIRRYNVDGSDVLEIDRNDIKNAGVNLVVDDFATIDSNGYIRHDSIKLAKAIMKIVSDNLDLTDKKQTLEYYAIKSKLKRLNKRKKKKARNILFRDVKIISGKKSNDKKNYTDIPVVGQKKK